MILDSINTILKEDVEIVADCRQSKNSELKTNVILSRLNYVISEYSDTIHSGTVAQSSINYAK